MMAGRTWFSMRTVLFPHGNQPVESTRSLLSMSVIMVLAGLRLLQSPKLVPMKVASTNHTAIARVGEWVRTLVVITQRKGLLAAAGNDVDTLADPHSQLAFP